MLNQYNLIQKIQNKNKKRNKNFVIKFSQFMSQYINTIKLFVYLLKKEK